MNGARAKAKTGRNIRTGLFANEMVRSARLHPGEFLELPFRTSRPCTITLVAAEREPAASVVLEQAYLLELAEAAQSVPLARKESLRGVVVTTLTETVPPRRNWVARVHNSGSHPQNLSLLVVVA